MSVTDDGRSLNIPGFAFPMTAYPRRNIVRVALSLRPIVGQAAVIRRPINESGVLQLRQHDGRVRRFEPEREGDVVHRRQHSPLVLNAGEAQQIHPMLE